MPVAPVLVCRLHHGTTMPLLERNQLGVALATFATVGLAGCATYSPGSFAVRGERFTGSPTTVGCLDLAVAGQRDPIARGPVVAFQFGNRCDHAVHVDLGAVRATGRTADGTRVAMAAFDPARALSAQKLEARRFGRQRLEYRSLRADADVIEVCLEVGAITERGQAALVCVAPDGDRVAEVVR
ncbi:MAG: hypothetical protein R3B06_07300 [Kofleriaceae bacterium]